MDKIATPQDLQGELRQILAYCGTCQPSRAVVASKLRELAGQVAGTERAAPTKVTPQRAKEIVEQARAQAKFGPWSDQLDKVMTEGERNFVKDHWGTLPGHKNFVDALMSVARGRAK
jgi:hypothetical protein